ncbi:MAG TPA: bifunctional transaldolase/phosoglucose isomerase, partial [Xanthobacteraceae bacterium]|nr:bifunctional transaldolase/phosoglucose isomerase [Xanthobacteraceae bacterium]
MNPLKALVEHGQSVWLDFLSRDFLQKGGLQRLIEGDGLGGVTSNPSIFEKAIAESAQYDDQIAQAVASGRATVTDIYEELAVTDIRTAADQLRPVFDKTSGGDGYVSLEVSPYLALDTQATIEEARRLWRMVGRENLMIKVPGTLPGIPAIHQLLSEGINVNITLLFSQDAYEDVIEAYLNALEDRADRGEPIDRIASVASFFVSRIDTAADKLIAKHIEQSKSPDEGSILERLRGKIAIANAKLAYQRYQDCFSGPRWERLAKRGARPQRLLWASTGTKNPDYSDVLYIEELIGPDTVNTMPLKTLEAFRDHGHIKNTLLEGVTAAKVTLEALERAGISLDAITNELVTDGVRLFADAFDMLLGALARKRKLILGTALNGQTMTVGEALQAEVERAQEQWRAEGNMRRLYQKDANLWTGHDEDRWLGWLDVADSTLKNTDELARFAEEVRAEQFTDAVLLGMGGSSLGPEVLAATFGSASGYPLLYVLDSTDPEQISSVEAKLDLARTLFIVSSKSGSTLEPNVLLDYFWARVGEVVAPDRVGSHFIAITDPGSSLQKIAEQQRFWRIFPGDPSIGGRYSVLSNFGMVPAAVIGLDVRRFLERSIVMERSCGRDVPPAENPGVQLGLLMGSAASRGRDKVTIVASPSIADFGGWAEQLIAESTGKNGKGLIPVDGEPLGDPAFYSDDRLFIYLRVPGEAQPAQDEAIEAIERAGHPVVRISVSNFDFIGQEFFRWEIATAVASAVLGVNAFDQPDVEASKVAARELTEVVEKQGALPFETPVFRENGVALFTDAANEQDLKKAGAAA